MFTIGSNAIPRYAATGTAMQLDRFYEEWGQKDDYPLFLQSLSSYEGHFYGLSWGPDARLLNYRKDFFREAGLDPEDPPITWDDLRL